MAELWRLVCPDIWSRVENLILEGYKDCVRCRLIGRIRLFDREYPQAEVFFLDTFIYLKSDAELKLGSEQARLFLVPMSKVASVEFGGDKKLTIGIRYSLSLEIAIAKILEAGGYITQLIEKFKKSPPNAICTNPMFYAKFYKTPEREQTNKDKTPLQAKADEEVMDEPNKIADATSALLNGGLKPAVLHFSQMLDADHRSHDDFLQLRESEVAEIRKFQRVKNFDGDGKPKICSTYPKEFLVLKEILDQPKLMEEMIAFREKQRIPVLCYIYKPRTTKITGYTTLWRSGQVKTGLTNKQCDSDIQLVKKIGEMGFCPTNKDNKAQIFDCRPYANAVGNKVMGKGFLDNKAYNIYDVHFGDIDNIHAMRKALLELLKAVEANRNPAAMIPWMGYLKAIMDGAIFVRDRLIEGISVIVNCSDGWDRTPQVVCLSKILLDPYYRTLDGFRILINYEWNGFGHKFQQRMYTSSNGEAAPIFVQFLDCVHQVMNQFPAKFEFNQKLLVILARACIENVFEEFNFDNTEQYLQYYKNPHTQDPSNQLCIWPYIYASVDQYLNPGYELQQELSALPPTPNARTQYFSTLRGGDPLDFDAHTFCFTVWTGCYNTFRLKGYRV